MSPRIRIVEFCPNCTDRGNDNPPGGWDIPTTHHRVDKKEEGIEEGIKEEEGGGGRGGGGAAVEEEAPAVPWLCGYSFIHLFIACSAYIT